ncbi:hypothetical protein AB0K60_35185 [Thermopolyspora sp. NPDC052614]|uniref:hypothetical protein n=1 Tax=Thermopolyspora sp. NPDC052614 TaxID=3155682 RepID=UPI00343907A5
MSEKELSAPELQALFLLMAEADEVSNIDLKQRYGYTLTGVPRTKLNGKKLVESRKQGRAYVHVLTDSGWARAKAELEKEEIRLGTGAAAATCLAVLRGLQRYLKRTGQNVSDVFLPYTAAQSEPAPTAEAAPISSATPQEAPAAPAPPAAMPFPPEDVEKRIRAAYAELAPGPGRHVPLLRLRALLTDLPREDVDAALTRMNLLPDVFVDPQANQKILTPEERAAAVRIADQDKHLISIEVR